jgi:CheY-like chemotaxis protein
MASTPHIMFVDDSEDDAVIACWHFAKAGIPVGFTIVASEPALVAELKQRPPDLIVCDLFIPGFDGFAALRIAQALTPTVPFVFHSGDMTEERSTTGLARGAYGCAQKDDEDALIELVKRAFASRI